MYVAVKQGFDRKMIEERRKLVDNVPLLQMLSDDHKTILADALELVNQILILSRNCFLRWILSVGRLLVKGKSVIGST